MPNYCFNFLAINGSTDECKQIFEFVKSDTNDFDFNKIIPMPDNIYRGGLGDKEREIYGENNWHDWSLKNWGTKWNSDVVGVSDDEVICETAWGPSIPVIEALAKIFPTVEFTYTYYEIGNAFCGKRVYENAELVFSYDGDYYENFYIGNNDEYAEKYSISDPLQYPVQYTGVFEHIQDVEEVENNAGYVFGKLHYREYAEGRILFRTDGHFVAKKDYELGADADEIVR